MVLTTPHLTMCSFSSTQPLRVRQQARGVLALAWVMRCRLESCVLFDMGRGGVSLTAEYSKTGSLDPTSSARVLDSCLCRNTSARGRPGVGGLSVVLELCDTGRVALTF